MGANDKSQSHFQALQTTNGWYSVTLLSLGTGGIRNNRRPLENEEPRDYENRCDVQWHRVSVCPERLGDIVMKNIVPGDKTARGRERACQEIPFQMPIRLQKRLHAVVDWAI
ncbi:unnamed protein product [Linum trigynum]|uniref:Single-stranded DNA-binding protein n=1 Tax=Linum trigynum TaxID=586398 RepID=A0AAV2FPR6_9ROSI